MLPGSAWAAALTELLQKAEEVKNRDVGVRPKKEVAEFVNSR
jgi:hypothetical protein